MIEFMVQYINKSALVAEIERRKQDAINNCGGFKSIREHECASCIVGQYEEMEEILDTLEVKETPVDAFIEETCEWLKENFSFDEAGYCKTNIYSTKSMIYNFKNTLGSKLWQRE